MFFDSFLVKSLTDYSLNIVGKVVMASTMNHEAAGSGSSHVTYQKKKKENSSKLQFHFHLLTSYQRLTFLLIILCENLLLLTFSQLKIEVGKLLK